MAHRLTSEDRAGLYITIIFHLVVLIILLLTQISAALKTETSFILDFSKQEEIEQIEKAERMKEEISRKLDDLIAAAPSGVPVRNVAVDRGSILKDDRNTDAEQLYKDAERLSQELHNGPDIHEDDNFIAQPEVRKKDEGQTQKKEYSGPSVVSYYLEGRKASKLSIPAYRCLGAGQVTVTITVDNSGNVLTAKVEEGVSTDDTCLKNFAIRAARNSKFSVSTTAPARQSGNIVYAFIAQ